jgi:hypothetical protein
VRSNQYISQRRQFTSYPWPPSILQVLSSQDGFVTLMVILHCVLVRGVNCLGGCTVAFAVLVAYEHGGCLFRSPTCIRVDLTVQLFY